jgi:hypothetical protein
MRRPSPDPEPGGTSLDTGFRRYDVNGTLNAGFFPREPRPSLARRIALLIYLRRVRALTSGRFEPGAPPLASPSGEAKGRNKQELFLTGNFRPQGGNSNFSGNPAAATERPPGNLSEREARVGFPAAQRGRAGSKNVQRPSEGRNPAHIPGSRLLFSVDRLPVQHPGEG